MYLSLDPLLGMVATTAAGSENDLFDRYAN